MQSSSKKKLDICIPDSQKNIQRETPWGLITYIEYKKIELSFDQFKKLKLLQKK